MNKTILLKTSFLFLFVFTLTGCGDGVKSEHTIVTGNVTVDGAPVSMEATEAGYPPMTYMYFYHIATKRSYEAAIENGTYSVTGHNTEGIPYGEYKVHFTQSTIEEPETDIFKDKFSIENTPHTATVSASGRLGRSELKGRKLQ
jgi:hypothetical protein